MKPDRTSPKIDHLVLPVASLDVSEERLAALGFQVAPRGRHPFGTENACIYLTDGIFLEPLAIVDAEAVGAAGDGGNGFIRRDTVFRREIGREGFSALVFSSDDAHADHDRFLAGGVSAGPILDFSRPFVDASGKSDTASFRLAFAAPDDAPGAFFFACQLVHVPAVDRTALTRHANGATALHEVVMASPEPAAVAKVATALSGNDEMQASDDGLLVEFAGGARLTIRQVPTATHHLFTEIVFKVASLDAAAKLLADNEVAFDRDGRRISVPAAPGQGATFAFEEGR